VSFKLELIAPKQNFPRLNQINYSSNIFSISKLDLEPTTSPSTSLLQEEEVLFELEVIGQIILVV
jgi:hypothetical protein